jgi:hypothetical protein
MKSKNTLLQQFFLVFIALTALVSCQTSFEIGSEKGNGKIVKQTRKITEKYDKIEVNRGIALIVTQNDIASVEVETDENIQSLITTKVENGVLIVSSKESFNTADSPKVSVSLPVISSLKSSSGATITNGNTIKTTSLIVDSSSGSEIILDVEADYISMESTSGSEITVSGKALKAETSSSSGSDIDAGKLMANEVFSQVSSGSSTKVYPILILKGKASSGGDIKYKNIPKNIEKEENSGGNISQY